jgi:thioredoxin 1
MAGTAAIERRRAALPQGIEKQEETPMKHQDAHNPITVTDQNFDREVLQSNLPVLVDFWADWCGPCKAVGPIIDKLASEYRGKAKVAKLDVDSNAIAARFGIRSIPTVLLFEDGNVIHSYVGVQPKQQYQAGLDALVVDIAEEQINDIY